MDQRALITGRSAQSSRKTFYYYVLNELQAVRCGNWKLKLETKLLHEDKYAYNETRYTMLVRSNPEAAKNLLELAQQDAQNRFKLYEHMASMPGVGASKEDK